MIAAIKISILQLNYRILQVKHLGRFKKRILLCESVFKADLGLASVCAKSLGGDT